jgi:hypothetical protein
MDLVGENGEVEAEAFALFFLWVRSSKFGFDSLTVDAIQLYE